MIHPSVNGSTTPRGSLKPSRQVQDTMLCTGRSFYSAVSENARKNRPHVPRAKFLGDTTSCPHRMCCLGWVGPTPQPQVLRRSFLVPKAEFTFQQRCRGRVRQPLAVDHLRGLLESFPLSNRPRFVPIITFLISSDIARSPGVSSLRLFINIVDTERYPSSLRFVPIFPITSIFHLLRRPSPKPPWPSTVSPRARFCLVRMCFSQPLLPSSPQSYPPPQVYKHYQIRTR